MADSNQADDVVSPSLLVLCPTEFQHTFSLGMDEWTDSSLPKKKRRFTERVKTPSPSKCHARQRSPKNKRPKTPLPKKKRLTLSLPKKRCENVTAGVF